MSSPPVTDSQTQASSLVDRIRREIVDGSLAPGAKLKVRDLVERYEVGASPLREALSRLTATSFVVAEDNRGFRVTLLSAQELERLTWTRIGVECMALRESIARGDLAWESSVVAAHHHLQHTPRPRDPREAPGKEWEAAHHELHRLLLSACGSPWLLEFIGVLYDRSSIYRRLAMRQPPAATKARALAAARRDTGSEHTAIMEAVVRRDADKACALLTAHYKLTQQLVGMSDALPRSPAKKAARR